MTCALRFPNGKAARWNFDDAVADCAAQLQEFANAAGATRENARSALIMRALEGVDGVAYGRSCVAPNGLAAQEIIIPDWLLPEFIEQSRHDIAAFVLLKEAAANAVECRTAPVQPLAFRQWSMDYILNRRLPPSREPQSWARTIRDRLVFHMVRNMPDRGIAPTRNEASEAHSGCDAVVAGASAVSLKALRTYETVRKIYHLEKRLSQARG